MTEVRQVRFSDLSDIKYDMYLAGKQRETDAPVLILQFSGEYRFGSAGNPDAYFMHAICSVAVIAWEPKAVILDLSELKYEWGDMLELAFNVPSRQPFLDPPLRVVVAGPQCREAIRTLVFGIGSTNTFADADWLYEDFDTAWNYVEQKIKAAPPTNELLALLGWAESNSKGNTSQ